MILRLRDEVDSLDGAAFLVVALVTVKNLTLRVPIHPLLLEW